MRLHGLDAEEGTRDGGAWVVRTLCLCGQPYTARAATVKRATRMIGRAHRDHRGFAAAAGPGGVQR